MERYRVFMKRFELSEDFQAKMTVEQLRTQLGQFGITPEQMFDLVSNVKSYPDFLPWCLGSRIISKDDNTLIADLIVGLQIYREKFRSKVILNKNENTIQVYYEDGPFKHLSNKWVFINKSGTYN